MNFAERVPAAWVAEVSRRLAGLDDGADTGPAVTALRTGIGERVAALPRRGRPVRTTYSGVSVSHTALAKLLTWALAEPAATVTAAVADVEIQVVAAELTDVYIHLIGIGAERRGRTYLQDGEVLREHGAKVLHSATGRTVAERAQITTVWDDLIVPAPTSEEGGSP